MVDRPHVYEFAVKHPDTVHQLTVDTYAVQHPGPMHADKSIAVHLCGLHLVLDRGIRPPRVPALLQRLVERIDTWPHYTPPDDCGSVTVFDVGLAGSPAEHIEIVEQWSRMVWAAWSRHHEAVSELVSLRLPSIEP